MRAHRVTASALVAAAALFTVGIASDAEASGSAQPAREASTAPVHTGVPVVIAPNADLGSQPAAAKVGLDSIYVTGAVSAGSHRFSYLVQTLTTTATDTHIESVVLTDRTTGWRKTFEVVVPDSAFHWEQGRLDIHTPALTWTGNDRNEQLTAKTPFGAVHLRLRARGPVLYYAGTGTFDLLGSQQDEYALPSMSTTGTLTEKGHSWQVRGDSWLDRQWGQPPDFADSRWTWMPFALPNGDKVAVWDAVRGGADPAEESWATVLHPDGTHEIVPVTPVARGVGHEWTSPKSGNTYATTWTITIPSLHAKLRVQAIPDAQEITSTLSAGYEGASTFSGTYEGAPVSGWTMAEQVGDWAR